MQPDERKKRTHRGTGVGRRLAQLAFVLFVVGLVLTLLAIWSERRAIAKAAWRDPAASIHVETVAPDLAILSLAGAADQQVLALSIEMGELETTRALLAFSVDLTDKQRMNGWLWLAQRYQNTGQTGRAAEAYRLAGSGALLSQDLPDVSRTESLLTVGEHLISLHDRHSARLYLQQAAIIAAHTPFLTQYHRRSLLERLIPVSLRAGGKREDWSDLATAVENDRSAGASATTSRSTGETILGKKKVEGDAVLIGARDARRAAAAAYLAAMSDQYRSGDAGKEEILPELAWAGATGRSLRVDVEKARERLRQALLAEDAAIVEYAARHSREQKNEPGVQETVLRWLLLKRRVARGGAGARLVPGWEAAHEEIDEALSSAWTQWLALHINSSDRESDLALQGLPAHTARRALLAAYWGLYPDAPIPELVLAARRTRDFGRLQLNIMDEGTPPVVGWRK